MFIPKNTINKYFRVSYVIVISIFILHSCNSDRSGFTLTGHVQNADSDYIFISIKGNVDSIFIDEKGAFTYEAVISEPEFYKLYFNADDPIHLLIDSTEDITLSINNESFSRSYLVTGSQGSLLVKDLMTHYYKTIDAIDSLKKLYNERMLYGNFETGSVQSFQDSIQTSMNEVVENEKQFLKDFITNNKTSFAAMSALFQTFDVKTSMPLLLDETENIVYFEMVDSNLKTQYPHSENVENFHLSLSQLKMNLQNYNQKQAAKEKTKVKIGDLVPEIKLKTLNNDTVILSSLRGKYVLIDFWASWCIPCRKENPGILKSYKRFHDKGFDVYQVSLDNSVDAWEDAVGKDSLIWKNQVIAEAKWNSAVVKEYGISSIPQNFLADPNGIIIDMNIHGKQLNNRLEKIFGDE